MRSAKTNSPIPQSGNLASDSNAPALAPPAFQLSASPIGNDAPIQCLMNGAVFKDSTRNRGFTKQHRPTEIHDIDQMLDDYNALGTPTAQAESHACFAKLHEIQNQAFGYYTQNGYDEDASFTEGMMALQEDIRLEHRHLTSLVVQNGWQIWAPGMDQMENDDKAKMDQTWSNIVNGEGGLTISENAKNSKGEQFMNIDGFELDIQSHLARLMATPAGRELLHTLSTGAKATSIEPTFADMTRKEQSASVKAYGADSSGVDRDQEVNGDIVPGVGGDTLVRFLPDAMATEILDKGTNGESILSPAFIALGHELIHAMHNLHGTTWTDKLHDQNRYRFDGEKNDYHNGEEFHTIDGVLPQGQKDPVRHEHITENLLRQENGLPNRKGHISGPRKHN